MTSPRRPAPREGEKTEGGWKEYNEEFVKRCFGEMVRAASPEGIVRGEEKIQIVQPDDENMKE